MANIVLKDANGDRKIYSGVSTLKVKNEAGDSVEFKEKPRDYGKYVVRVIDYDGSILKEEWLNKGDVFVMPDEPTHDRLTFQEWVAPVDITDNTVTVGESDIIMGAIYTTKSGLSEFDITLTKVTGLNVTLNMNGTKDWGDGTSDTATSHTYADYGDYTITCDGTTMNASSSTGLFGQGSSVSTYNNSLINARLCSVQSINSYTFRGCRNLESLACSTDIKSFGYDSFTATRIRGFVCPNTITSIGDRAFESNALLSNLVLPNSNFSLGGSFLAQTFVEFLSIPENIRSLSSSGAFSDTKIRRITFPKTITSLGSFGSNPSYWREINFSLLETIPTLTSSMSNLNQLCKIYVPDLLYNQWIVATNWTSLANYIYKSSEMEV